MPAKKKTVALPRIADPTIATVFERFLRDQKGRLVQRTYREYQRQRIIGLLQDHLDGYAYQSLPKPEAAFFEKHYNASGDDHREFSQIFGPDRIADELGMFLNYFMVRKVIAGPDTMRAAGTVTKKLCRWLAEHGHIDAEEGAAGSERGAAAARELPAARRAADIMSDGAARLGIDPSDLPDADYKDFDHYEIPRVERGKLWFEDLEERRKRTLGPVPVSPAATALLQPGWTVSCALGRVRGTWRLVEVANVYP